MGSKLHRRGPAKVFAGPMLVLALTAAAAYAAVGPVPGHGRERRGEGEPLPATPTPATVRIAAAGSSVVRITEHPPLVSTRTTTRFAVAAVDGTNLSCALDRRAPRPCPGAILYRGLGSGDHLFTVTAKRPGRALARASFAWTVLEPKPFKVSTGPGAIGPLFPGSPPSTIPVVVTNPNEVAITITALTVTASGGPAGCTPADNLALTAPALTSGRLRVPAHGSVSLPTASVAAPTIELRDLDHDQDPCQGANFDLTFSGSGGA